MSGNLHERYFNLHQELEAKQSELGEIERRFEIEIQRLNDKRQELKERCSNEKRSVAEQVEVLKSQISQVRTDIETRYNDLMQAKKAESNG